MKKNNRVVPKKNYLYLLLMITLVVVLTFYIFSIKDKINERKLENSYFKDYINEITTKELNTILTEPNSEQFILITKTNDEAVYNFEVDLKKVIKKRELRDNFIYIDYTDEKEINGINKELKTNIKSIPAIIYLKNGEVMKTIDSKEQLLRVGDFEKLLDEYEVE